MTDDRRKQLIAEIKGSEKLCEYCPLDENCRGSYSTPSGNSAGCEGSRCSDAMESYLDEMESADREPIRTDKEQYLTESILELHSIENNDKLKAAISDLTDAELDEKVEFADYLEGK